MPQFDCWILAEKILARPEVARRVIMYGKPGTGKTTAACRSAGSRYRYSITLTEEMSVAELVGHFVPKASEFIWHDGPAIRAWRNGGLLVLNEIDLASGPVQTALLGILDDMEIAEMTLPSGETVKPSTGFSAIATMNGTPDALSEPLLDRFEASILIDMPHQQAVAVLSPSLQKVCLNSYSTADGPTLSYRQILNYDKMVKAGYSQDDAAKAAFGMDKYREALRVIKLGSKG